VLLKVPPPPGSGSVVKFEIVPEAGEEAGSTGDRAGVYKRLQNELVQQTRVGVVRVLSSWFILIPLTEVHGYHFQYPVHICLAIEKRYPYLIYIHKKITDIRKYLSTHL